MSEEPTPATIVEHNKAKLSEAYSPMVNHFEVHLHLDLGEHAVQKLKVLCIPFAYACFLPAAWDAAEQRKEAREILGIDDLTVPPDESIREFGTRNLMVAGGTDAEDVYESVRSSMRGVLSNRSIVDPEDDHEPFGTGTLEILPIKVALATLHYYTQTVRDPEHRDRVNVVIDKLVLFSYLPQLLSKGRLSQFLGTGQSAVKDLAGFDAQVKKFLATLSVENPSAEWLYETTHRLKIRDKDKQWKAVFELTKDWGGKQQVLLPLDFLEDVCRTNLQEFFDTQKESETIKKLWEKVEKLVDSAKGESKATPRQKDFRFFYPLIDEHLGQVCASRMNVYKFPFRRVLPESPFFDRIDLRPLIWVSEANSLSTELALARNRLALAASRLGVLKEKIRKDPAADFGVVDKTVMEIREASRALCEVRRNVEVLKDELGESGYTLKTEGGLDDRDVKRIVRKYWVSRRKSRPRKRRVSWVERRVRSIRIAFLKIAYRVYYVRRWRWQHYTEWKTVFDLKEEPLDVEWRPIDEYLSRKIPGDTYTVSGNDGKEDTQATAAAKARVKDALGLKDDVALQAAKNAEKDLHILELTPTGYRDQHGVSLEQLLFEAEDETVRARVLILVPVHETRLDGQPQLVGYHAVHNPVAPRRSLRMPRVYFVETYAHTMRQLPGHWLGPLSHTVTLFPGETRHLKIRAESRFVTQQKQETRESQRTAVERKASLRRQVKSDLTRTRESTKRHTWNVNASGSYGAGFYKVGASAGASGEYASSQGSIARNINDRLEETVQNVSSSNEVQFASSSEITISETTTSEQLVEITNVNHGRCVTHKFFQILHQHKSDVRLKDIRVVVEHEEEWIPGIDISVTESYGLDELDRMFPELFEEDREAVIKKVKEAVTDRCREKELDLDEGKITEPKSLETRSWFVNSGYYLVDTEVSPSSATEPYVEEARQAEVAVHTARAKRLEAEAEAIRGGKQVLPASASEFSIELGTEPEPQGDEE